jgi:hypothetical protein
VSNLHRVDKMKQENISERQKNIEFDIVHWRERFARVKKKAPKNWMKCLAEFNPGYNTHEGSLTMLAVANKRAGLAKTARLVADLEEMIQAPEKPASVFDRWKKKGLLSK